jgi:hypothetical protein
MQRARAGFEPASVAVSRRIACQTRGQRGAKTDISARSSTPVRWFHGVMLE